MTLDLPFLDGIINPLVLSQSLAFVQVVFIDVVMAGDNALAVGIAAAGLAPDKRRLAIFYGLIGAVVLRIGFVLLTVTLLEIPGLLLAGGFLLLWVCWKMWTELHDHHAATTAPDPEKIKKTKTLSSAVLQILAADVSMSLDNVLAVAGVSQQYVAILAFGLLFSIALMGFAANMIADILHRYRWIGYMGVLVVLAVALKMIYEGGLEIWILRNCDSSLKCISVALQEGREAITSFGKPATH